MSYRSILLKYLNTPEVFPLSFMALWSAGQDFKSTRNNPVLNTSTAIVCGSLIGVYLRSYIPAVYHPAVSGYVFILSLGLICSKAVLNRNERNTSDGAQ